jgi:hypothetical protein
MTELSLSPDGSTLTVFIPMTWRRRGGRKVIVAPPGAADWAPPPKIDGALVKALVRAHRWRRLLEEGRFGTLTDLADAERISRSYVCRVVRLTLLAPGSASFDRRCFVRCRPPAARAAAPLRLPGSACAASGWLSNQAEAMPHAQRPRCEGPALPD